MTVRLRALFFPILFLSLLSTACAQSKRATVRSGAAYARVTRATSERIIPGRKEGQIVTNYRIYLTWRSSKAPAAFFWRPDDGWMNAIVVKPGGAEEEISPESLKAGQAVEVVPMPGGRFPTPAFVKTTAKNTLYFKIGASWYSLPVTLTKKPNIIAP